MSQQLPDFDLTRFLPYRMTVAAERLSAALARRYRREFGISIPEWRVLVHLAHAGQVSVRDIERRAGLEKSKASRAASRLEAEGLISKQVNTSDRRLLHLALTDKGRAMMSELLPTAIAYQGRLEALVGAHMASLDAALDLFMQEDDTPADPDL